RGLGRQARAQKRFVAIRPAVRRLLAAGEDGEAEGAPSVGRPAQPSDRRLVQVEVVHLERLGDEPEAGCSGIHAELVLPGQKLTVIRIQSKSVAGLLVVEPVPSAIYTDAHISRVFSVAHARARVEC